MSDKVDSVFSGLKTPVTATAGNREIWESILFAYKVDPGAPSYLHRGNQIFETKDDESDITIFSKAEAYWRKDYSDNEHSAAKNTAASMSISGHYGAFSAAASMEISSSSDTKIKTVRMDAICRAITHEVSSNGDLRTFPEEFLTENFNRSVKALSVVEIEENIGSFYLKSMDLGGELRKSYTMQATSTDTETSVKAELEAEYGSKMLGASAEADVGVSTRKSVKSAEMKVEWTIKGGDTTIWLGKDFDDDSLDHIEKDWAKSINPKNLYPFNYKVGLLWDLVKKVNQQKGEAFQEYLEKNGKLKEANSIHHILLKVNDYNNVASCNSGCYF